MEIREAPEHVGDSIEMIEEEGTPTIIEVRDTNRTALCIILGCDTDCTDEELLVEARKFRGKMNE